MNNMKDLHCPAHIGGGHPVKPIHRGPHFLEKYNFLSEFETALEKKFARENLGITWETFGSDLLNTEGFLELVRKIIEELLAEMSSVNWGNIKGDIRNQEDLILYIADSAFKILKVDSVQDLDLNLEEGTIAFVKNLKTLFTFNGTSWELLKSGSEEVDFGDIPERLNTAEDDISNLKNRVTTLEGEVTDLKETSTDLLLQINGTNERIYTTLVRITDLELRTTTIEALIEALNRAIAALLDTGEVTINMTYLPSDSIPDNTISTHGGINSSKASLKGKSFSELMDLILFPALLPTITNPSVLWFNVTNGIKEVGTALTAIPNVINYDSPLIKTNLGSVKFGNVDATDPEGLAVLRSTGWDGVPTITKVLWGATVLPGTQTVTVKCDYKVGTAIYDSLGKKITDNTNLNADKVLKAGTCTATATVTGCYKCLFNDEALTLQPLTKGLKWLVRSNRFGSLLSTFICPATTQVNFKIQNKLASNADSDGYTDDGSEWTMEEIITPESIVAKDVDYVKYTRVQDAVNTVPIDLKIEIKG